MENELVKLICKVCKIEFYMKRKDLFYAVYCTNCRTTKIRVAE